MRYQFVWIFLLIGEISFAQKYNFRHYQIEQGLPHNWVLDIEQDRFGLMWFGTHDGLSRFDGRSFKTFRRRTGDPLSLGSSHVGSLFLSHQGDLYAGTGSGLYRYDAIHENFRAIPMASRENVVDVCGDRSGNIYFLTEKEVFAYNEGSNKVRLVWGSQEGRCTGLFLDRTGSLWIGTAKGILIKTEPRSSLVVRNRIRLKGTPNGNVEPVKILDTGDGTLWVGTRAHGLFRVNPSANLFEDITLFDKEGAKVTDTRQIIEDAEGRLWIGSESGIFIYDPSAKRAVNLCKVQGVASSLSDNAIHCLYRDNQDGVWVGTYFGGINYYTKAAISFDHYLPGPGPNSISGSIARGICEDGQGNIWVGTEDNGLNKINPGTGQVVRYQAGKKNSPISYQNLHGMTVASGLLWIGTYFHGLDVINTQGQRKRHYESGPTTFANDFIISLLTTRTGKVIAGTEYDLVEIDPRTFRFRPLMRDIVNIPRYYCLLEDRAGYIWIGTRGFGVLRLDPKTHQIRRFRSGADSSSLGHDHINDIFQDSRGAIWVGTDGGGLCKLDSGKARFERYTLDRGMPSDYIFKILEDKNGLIWASSSRGLVCLDPITKHKTKYTTLDGLITDQFNFSSGYRAENGTLYFGTVKGLVCFNPGLKSARHKSLPPVVFTGLQINYRDAQISGNSSVTQSILVSKQLVLPENKSTFRIEFASPDYGLQGKISYAFRMEGLQSDWTVLPDGQSVHFTKLAPGNYTFYVKAAGPDGHWQQSPAFIHIRIDPPLWATGWAWFLYSAGGLSVTYYLFRRRQAQQKQKFAEQQRQYEQKKERELYESKLDFLSSIAHELNTPLTLIKGPVEEVISHIDNPRLVAKYASMISRNTDRLIRLCQQLLDFRKTESDDYKLHIERVDIVALTAENVKPFLDHAQYNNMRALLSLPDEPVYVMGDREALTKIISNLFSNAVKYGEAKFVCRLVVQKVKGRCELRLMVMNDGALIPEEMREAIFDPFVRLKEAAPIGGTGIGLSISRSLANLHGADLWVEQIEGLNSFILSISCNQEMQA